MLKYMEYILTHILKQFNFIECHETSLPHSKKIKLIIYQIQDMYYLIQMSYNLGVKQTYKIVLIELFVKRYTIAGDSIY